MKQIIALIFILAVAISCKKPNELPPKTDSITTDYLLPQGPILTAEEYEANQAIVKEYREATK